MDETRFAQLESVIENVSRETLTDLDVYEKILRQWQAHINLVAEATLSDIWTRHILDSAQLFPLAQLSFSSEVSENKYKTLDGVDMPGYLTNLPKNWLDIGSGSGFPGLVLSILIKHMVLQNNNGEALSRERMPILEQKLRTGKNSVIFKAQEYESEKNRHPAKMRVAERSEVREQISANEYYSHISYESCGYHVTLIESNHKKAAFLRRIVASLHLPVQVFNQRIEAIDKTELPKPDIITARALANLPKLLEMVAPFFGTHTIALLPKGRDFLREIKQARLVWHFDLKQHPSITDADSAILVISNLHSIH